MIKAQEERGVATAVGRKVRWESRQPGRHSAVDVEGGTVTAGVTGNSANAQHVAENEAKKVGLHWQAVQNSNCSDSDILFAQILTKRVKAYGKYKLPKELGNAGVSLVAPLTFFHDGKIMDCASLNSHCYGFVIVESVIMVAKGKISRRFNIVIKQLT